MEHTPKPLPDYAVKLINNAAENARAVFPGDESIIIHMKTMTDVQKSWLARYVSTIEDIAVYAYADKRPQGEVGPSLYAICDFAKRLGMGTIHKIDANGWQRHVRWVTDALEQGFEPVSLLHTSYISPFVSYADQIGYTAEAAPTKRMRSDRDKGGTQWA